MYKHLLYAALGLIGLMGTLAIGVVNATTTISEPYGHVEYTLNENKDFEAQVITITDGTDTITILDRNLGAKKAGTGCEDPNWLNACALGDDTTYGYHFQRGNNYGFDPLDTSIKENAKPVSSDGVVFSGIYDNSGYYGTTFIKGDSSHGYDYWGDSTSSSSNHENLRGGGGDYNDTNNGFGKNNENRRGPCPEGFHVPSYGELQKLQNMLNADGKRNKDTLHDKLLIPFAGRRYASSASVVNMGSYANLWSSSPISASYPYSRLLDLGVGGYLGMYNGDRASANSVRCFYDFYQPFPQSLTLSFMSGDMVLGTGEVVEDKVYTGDIPNVTETGYILEYRYLSGADATTGFDFENEAITGGMANEEGVVYFIAKWTPVEYAITFVDGSGTETTVVYSGDYDSAVNTQYPVWTKNGYTISWDKEIPATMPLNGDMITANWTANEYTITYELDGGTNSENNTGIYTIETPDIILKNPTKDGYTFNGWFIDSQFTTGITTIPTGTTGNITLYAKWTVKSKTSGGSSGGGGRSSSKDVISNDSEKSSEQPAGSQVDSSEQAPQNDNSNTQDSSANTSEGHAYTEEFQEAYEFAYEKGITTMPTIEQANMNGKLTRIAMAKMLSYYAINVLGQKPDETRINKFNDITEKLDAQYDSGVTLAYQLGIMGINMPNNNFRPNDEVTRAEFATALSRMLYSTPDGKPYYTTHLEKLKTEKILTNDDYKMKELRGYVMIMLMRSAGK